MKNWEIWFLETLNFSLWGNEFEWFEDLELEFFHSSIFAQAHKWKWTLWTSELWLYENFTFSLWDLRIFKKWKVKNEELAKSLWVLAFTHPASTDLQILLCWSWDSEMASSFEVQVDLLHFALLHFAFWTPLINPFKFKGKGTFTIR